MTVIGLHSAGQRSPRRSWAWIAWVSAGISAVALTAGIWILPTALGLLAALFLSGGLAGALATRHGWLAGIIVGIPFAFQQVTRHALVEYGSLGAVLAAPSYWLIALPAAVLAASVGVLGGISGVWLFGAHFTPRS